MLQVTPDKISGSQCCVGLRSLALSMTAEMGNGCRHNRTFNSCDDASWGPGTHHGLCIPWSRDEVGKVKVLQWSQVTRRTADI